MTYQIIQHVLYSELYAVFFAHITGHIPPSVVVQLLPAHTELIRRQMPGQL